MTGRFCPDRYRMFTYRESGTHGVFFKDCDHWSCEVCRPRMLEEKATEFVTVAPPQVWTGVIVPYRTKAIQEALKRARQLSYLRLATVSGALYYAADGALAGRGWALEPKDSHDAFLEIAQWDGPVPRQFRFERTWREERRKTEPALFVYPHYEEKTLNRLLRIARLNPEEPVWPDAEVVVARLQAARERLGGPGGSTLKPEKVVIRVPRARG